MAWSIQMYETPSGQAIIENFIRKMQPVAQAKLLRQLDLLEEFGGELSMPHTKPLGNGLYELRMRGKQEIRIFSISLPKAGIFTYCMASKRKPRPLQGVSSALQENANTRLLIYDL